eukprot:c16563_g3_i1 orf=1-1035(-)
METASVLCSHNVSRHDSREGKCLEEGYAKVGMPWDSMSTPCDWETAVIFQGQGSSFLKRVPRNEWTNETEVAVLGERECPQMELFCSPGLGPRVGRAGFSPSTLTSSVSTHTDGQNDTGGFEQRESPEKTIKSMSECFLPNGCDSLEGKAARSAGQSRFDDMHIRALNETNMDFIELRSEMLAKGIEENELDLTVCEAVGRILAQIPAGLERPSVIAGDCTETDGKVAKDCLFGEEDGIVAASRSSGDSLTCLKLGKRTYYKDPTWNSGGKPAFSSAITSCSVAVKRARAVASGAQIPRCQVEGCKVDLMSAKDYHRRHKVCAFHSKEPKVMVASLEQRFCQQCS